MNKNVWLLMKKDFSLSHIQNFIIVIFIPFSLAIINYNNAYGTFVFLGSLSIGPAVKSMNLKDMQYSMSLPITREDFIKSKLSTSIAFEFLSVLVQAIAIFLCPKFSIFSSYFDESTSPTILPSNVFYISFLFFFMIVMNFISFPYFFKHINNTQKVSRFYLLNIATSTFISAVPIAFVNKFIFPVTIFLKSTDVTSQLHQLPILTVTFILWCASWFVIYKIGVKNFEKVSV